MGREASSEFGESIAPEVADEYTLLSTLLFYAHDVGRPVKYIPPAYALDIEKSGILENRKVPGSKGVLWYYEIGGGLNQISDAEEITRLHRSLTFGIWDYVKNKGGYSMENYDLDFVGCIPGKRESRRLMGDYILTQNDITRRCDHEDGVAYGGWSIDLHSLMGVYGKDPVNTHYMLDGIYQIPYRCFYSRNINNLFVVGRCLSATHVAFGTTRVSATLALGGQAVGTAAYLCKKYGVKPRGIYERHVKELRQLLLDQDCYVVGEKWANPYDFALQASVNASSVASLKLDEPEQMVPLDSNHGFSLPVEKYLGHIQIFAEADEDTTLEYEMYISDKRENYHPAFTLRRGTVKTEKGSGWVILDADLKVDRMFVFVELKQNPHIKIAYCSEQIPGVTCVRQYSHSSISKFCSPDGNIKNYFWQGKNSIQGFSICFESFPEEDIYGPRYVNNGYLRPYGLPNLWMACGVQNEWLEIILDKEYTIDRIRITFDALLGFRVGTNEYHDFNTLPTIIRDYDVYIRKEGTYQHISRITGNYERVNTIHAGGVRGDAVKIIVGSTNGSKRAAIQNVNIF